MTETVASAGTGPLACALITNVAEVTMARPVISTTMAEAVADVPNGITLLIPGFGVGAPINLLTALYYQGASEITAVINGTVTASADPKVKNLGNLVEDGRVRKYISSFTASTRPSRVSKPEQLAREGKLEVELVPQGTVAERIRAGGAGVPAFYTQARWDAAAEGRALGVQREDDVLSTPSSPTTPVRA
jgi:3-oxoadipate CoA-transferase alpha subunit